MYLNEIEERINIDYDVRLTLTLDVFKLFCDSKSC